jgi:dihydroorotate dehydrogenase electron transfer subunit
VPAPPDDARSFTARVAAVTACGDDAVRLALELDRELPPGRASRFFMLRREDGTSPAIPPPISVYLQPPGRREFLIKVMGRGTRALADCAPGTKVRAIGPLGNGWPALDGEGAPWVLLAGGVGSAPFPMAVEQALAGMDGRRPAARERLHFLFGAGCAGLLYDLDWYRAQGIGVHTATVDGSHGMRGNVLDLLRELWRRGDVPERVRLLACGPERMLEAVSALALERDLPCWLSLETLMGCGVGICNGCPVPTRPDGPLGAWPNAKCCVEGPVFSVDAVTLAHGGDHGAPAEACGAGQG